MEKIITVGKTGKPKSGYIESLTISGAYLKLHGFTMGDLVKLEIKKNKIVISKNDNTEMLTKLGLKNPSVLKLVEGLALTTE